MSKKEESRFNNHTTQEILASGTQAQRERRAMFALDFLSNFFVLTPDSKLYDPPFEEGLAKFVFYVVCFEGLKQKAQQHSLVEGVTVLDRLRGKMDLVFKYSPGFRAMDYGYDRQLTEVRNWLDFMHWMEGKLDENQPKQVLYEESAKYIKDYINGSDRIRMLKQFKNYREIVDFIKRSLYN